MPDKTKSSHHTVPQFYLKGFLDKRIGKIAVLDKTSKNITYKAVHDVAAIEGFYNVVSESGEETSHFEDLYCKAEDKAARIIKRMLDKTFVPPLCSKERGLLSQYLSMQFMRTTKSRRREQLISDYCTKGLILDKLRERGKKDLTKNQLGFIEDPHKIGEFALSQDSATILGVELAKRYYYLFYYRRWSMIVYDKPSLITSDNPIILCPYPNSKQNGLFTAAEIWFPIDSRRLLVLSDFTSARNQKLDCLVIRPHKVGDDFELRTKRNANILQAQQSYMELFGQKELLEEHRESCPAPISPISFSDRESYGKLEQYYDTNRMDLAPIMGYGASIEEVFKQPSSTKSAPSKN